MNIWRYLLLFFQEKKIEQHNSYISRMIFFQVFRTWFWITRKKINDFNWRYLILTLLCVYVHKTFYMVEVVIIILWKKEIEASRISSLLSLVQKKRKRKKKSNFFLFLEFNFTNFEITNSYQVLSRDDNFEK